MNRMSAEASLNLYITAIHPCPYLPDHQAMNLLVDPCYRMTADLYARLLESGFRRSGGDVYRPHCKGCSACISSRIPVSDFTPSRSQRRNLQRNRDVQVTINRAGFKPEYAELYRRYINHRHYGGGMDSDSTATFASFLLSPWCTTALVEFRAGERLLAVAAVDELKNSLSSVYTFFDPEEGEPRGLGTYAVLWQIGQARELGLPFVYPGYWIDESPKMRYKIRFQPLEGLVEGNWISLSANK
jgi:arginyl-tRNA--protein-N-Asp/Glu arginylyltransferase